MINMILKNQVYKLNNWKLSFTKDDVNLGDYKENNMK